MRTGGSTGIIPRKNGSALPEGDGYFWDLTTAEGKSEYRLPVKYRYRSPVVFEFQSSSTTGRRKVDAWAVIWLHHLVDNEESPINVPIWKTAHPARLYQNYITEDNWRQEPGLEDLEEVGRMQFRGRFNPGMDESHGAFVVDNNTRETYETWEACFSEGVRKRTVDVELPERVQELHEKSLTEGRDVLKSADDEEKEKWLTKEGTDWSGAFGHDPRAYMDRQGRKRREPGAEDPIHDPYHPSSDEDNESDFDGDTSEDLGIQDATNMDRGGQGGGEADEEGQFANGRARSSTDAADNKKTEERKHRGLMQWRPARNMRFAKDEGKIGLKKLKKKFTGGLDGRKPTVETGKFFVPVLPRFDIVEMGEGEELMTLGAQKLVGKIEFSPHDLRRGYGRIEEPKSDTLYDDMGLPTHLLLCLFSQPGHLFVSSPILWSWESVLEHKPLGIV